MRGVGINTWVWTWPLTAASIPLVEKAAALGFDAITIPVEVLQEAGGAPAAWFSPSPNPAIYTVDSSTGLLTAVSPGGPVGFVVHAGSAADTGAVDVRLLTDTTGGRSYFTVLGTVIRRAGAQARAVNYRRQGDTLTFRLNSGIPTTGNAVENVVITLRDAVTGPGTYPIDSLSLAEAFGTGADPICRPPRAWALWSTRTTTPTVTALSRDGGSITVTQVVAVPGGLAISGRFRFDAFVSVVCRVRKSLDESSSSNGSRATPSCSATAGATNGS